MNRKVLDLTDQDPVRCGLSPDAVELEAIVSDARASANGDGAGALRKARDAVASYLAGHGASVAAARIQFVSSREAALRGALQALGADGAEILVPCPGPSTGSDGVPDLGGRTARYDLRYEGAWQLDRRSVERAATAQTRAIVVGNPLEPTGAALRADDLSFLERLCATRRISLLGDEAHADTVPAGFTSVLRVTRCAAVHVSGLAATCGVAGLGVEWYALGNAQGEPGSTGDAEVPEWALLATPPLLARREQFLGALRRRIAANRASLAAAAVREAPWSLLWGQGGRCAVLEIGAAEQERSICAALLDDGVAVRPGSAYGLPETGYLVVSLLPPPDVFAEALSRLDRRLRAPLA